MERSAWVVAKVLFSDFFFFFFFFFCFFFLLVLFFLVYIEVLVWRYIFFFFFFFFLWVCFWGGWGVWCLFVFVCAGLWFFCWAHALAIVWVWWWGGVVWGGFFFFFLCGVVVGVCGWFVWLRGASFVFVLCFGGRLVPAPARVAPLVAARLSLASRLFSPVACSWARLPCVGARRVSCRGRCPLCFRGARVAVARACVSLLFSGQIAGTCLRSAAYRRDWRCEVSPGLAAQSWRAARPSQRATRARRSIWMLPTRRTSASWRGLRRDGSIARRRPRAAALGSRSLSPHMSSRLARSLGAALGARRPGKARSVGRLVARALRFSRTSDSPGWLKGSTLSGRSAADSSWGGARPQKSQVAPRVRWTEIAGSSASRRSRAAARAPACPRSAARATRTRAPSGHTSACGGRPPPRPADGHRALAAGVSHGRVAQLQLVCTKSSWSCATSARHC